MFDDKLSCHLQYSKISHKKYKNFESQLNFALDWEDCEKLIPIQDINIYNTLSYIFHKFRADYLLY